MKGGGTFSTQASYRDCLGGPRERPAHLGQNIRKICKETFFFLSPGQHLTRRKAQSLRAVCVGGITGVLSSVVWPIGRSGFGRYFVRSPAARDNSLYSPESV